MKTTNLSFLKAQKTSMGSFKILPNAECFFMEFFFKEVDDSLFCIFAAFFSFLQNF